MNPWLPRGLAAAAYRRLIAPVARRRLRRLREAGLPAPLARPCEVLFTGALSEGEAAAVRRVEGIRRELARRPDRFPLMRPSDGGTARTGAVMAHAASVDPAWGAFLMLLAGECRAQAILELGSGAGISACYLASAGGRPRVLTVEGVAELASCAGGYLARISDRATVWHATFDEAIDRLADFSDRVDLVYVDGHHRREARIHYLDRLGPWLGPGSVVVLDDIHFSEELWQAWAAIARRPGVACAVAVGRFGVLVMGEGGGGAAPRRFDLCALTGSLRVAGRRWKRPRELQPVDRV